MLTYFKAFSPAKTEYNRISSTPNSLHTTTILLWTVIGIGIFFRLFHYFDNRSLWIDELYLSSSLIRMNFFELAGGQLDYQQKAPLGFLWLAKLSVVLFGKKEMALRLIPLLSGIASLFVFLPVARFFLKPLGAAVAVSILALAPVLVYYSVEIKQYSTEMFATVLCLYLYTRYYNRQDLKSLILWGVWGALILWFSFSAIFILAGIAVGLSLHYLLKKDWNKLFCSLIPFSLWLLSFGFSFYLFISSQPKAGWLVEWFRKRGGFLPHDASLGDIISWLFQSVYTFMEYPLGILWSAHQIKSIENPVLEFFLKLTPLVLLCWILGYAAYFRKDKRHFLMILLFPFLLTLLAVMLEKYPFFNRLRVFLAPIPILLIAHGCQQLFSLLPTKLGRLRYVLPLVLLLWPIYRSTLQVIKPDLFGDGNKSDYREGFLYLQEHVQEGDLVYLYWNTAHIYDYYQTAYNLNFDVVQLPDLRSKSEGATDYLNQLTPLLAEAEGNKRVWLVYDNYLDMQIGEYENQYPWYKGVEDVKSGRLLHREFATKGKEIDSFHKIDIVISLFDLSR
ncbi:hypothetical protein D770_05945 [Flammeovirgaceae bacterium 311]|nr:hypothetical protein D770_05945 [Flammeovirgaceae bacterium 311]